MKAAKTQSSIEPKATQAESKATLPVVPSSAADVELNSAELTHAESGETESNGKEAVDRPMPAENLGEGKKDNALYSAMLGYLARLILGYGENEQQAMRQMQVDLRHVHRMFLQGLAFPKTDIEKRDWEEINHRFEQIVDCFEPVDYDNISGFLIYSPERIARFYLDTVFDLKQPTLQMMREQHQTYEKLYRHVAHVAQQAKPQASLTFIYELYKPLNDLLSVLDSFTLEYYTDEHVSRLEKAAA